MYYIATARNHAGEVAKIDTRYVSRLHPVIGISKRKARTAARTLARIYGMRGKLSVTVERVTKKKPTLDTETRSSHPLRVVASNPLLAAPYDPANAVPVDYAKVAASIFPVTVKRVDDPALTRPRYHVLDATGRTVKAFKIKKEAEEYAYRVNFSEGVRERCDKLTSGEG